MLTTRTKFTAATVGTILLVFIYVLSISSAATVEAARRTIVEDGELFRTSDVFGSKRFGNNRDIRILFDERSGLLLVGKGFEKSSDNAHATAGTKLALMQDDGTDERMVSEELVEYAQFDKTSENVIYLTNSGRLYRHRVSDGSTEQITIEASIPDISPDNSRLVFKKAPRGWSPGDYFEGSPGIAVKDLTTGEEKIISNVDGDYAPLWSPDGKQVLVFNEGIHIMNADGTGRVQLTKPGDGTGAYGISDDPLWSSDGRYFLYEADGTIYILELDATKKKVITAGPIASGFEPRWVEEGKTISVVSKSAKAGTPALSILTLDGKVIKGNRSSESSFQNKRRVPSEVVEVRKESSRTVPIEALKLEPQEPREIITPQSDVRKDERKHVPPAAVILQQ